MAIVVGVKFKKTGKVYHFDPSELELQIDDQVVVETARGQEIGHIASVPAEIPDEELKNELKPVVRKADEADIERMQELEQKEEEALKECRALVERLNLQMKPLSAEYSLDGNRLTIYFSAAERVDFRELVRELARKLKVRVEMRQTGPRDEARMVGGCGRCGRELCCSSWLNEFAPVAMRMAKDQGLPLNPMKISGCCGRLMCCLVYENEQYRESRKKLPKNGQMVYTAAGEARVVGSNPLKETVMVVLENDVTQEYPLTEITLEPVAAEKPRPRPERRPRNRNRDRDRDKESPDNG